MKTTTKWNNDPLCSPCYYFGTKCNNEQKGLIQGKMYNCRLECDTYKEYEDLKTEYHIKIDAEKERRRIRIGCEKSAFKRMTGRDV